MSKPPELSYTDAEAAPVIYFDVVAANGTMNGTIQIELAARILTPLADGAGVKSRFITTGRLRCSPAAAAFLRDALDNSLQLLSPAHQQPIIEAGRPN